MIISESKQKYVKKHVKEELCPLEINIQTTAILSILIIHFIQLSIFYSHYLHIQYAISQRFQCIFYWTIE